MDGAGCARRMSRPLPLKRKRDSNVDVPKVSLERVLGLTANTNAMLAVDPVNNVIAYPAGCVIVLHKKNKQDQIFNHSKKTITSLAFSPDGKFLVTGECGHQPAVRVFSVEEKVQVAEFHGHKFGVACVAFSPNHKYIISIGTQHDMMVNVWSWRSENKAASNKVSCKVNAVNFSEGGSMFVTVGNRHVKFWYLDASQSEVRNETVPLLGRSGILADLKNNNFVDVVCGRGDCAGSTFVITQSGLLCEFSVNRLLVRHVELRTIRAYALSGGDDILFVGCADGIIRAFNPKTLQFMVTLPKPHPLGIDIMSGSSSGSADNQASYPEVVAVCYSQEKRELVSINNDHSLYVWDIRDLRRVGKIASFLYHSSCIWGIEVYPPCESEMLGMLPPGSFVTCSSDDTIRVWNLDPHWHAVSDSTPKRNIYSTELLKIVYTDPSLSCLCEQDTNQANSADKADGASDTRTGVRCISVSPDGLHLASGDRSGNLRLHDLQFMDEMTVIEAHDSEILCLEFSNYSSGHKLLCSASRDRLIHVFDVSEGYSLLQTLDDHSASVISVKLTWSLPDQTMWMLSCGADKSILFRSASCGGDLPLQFTLRHHLVSKSTLHDMIVDPTQKFTVTACQDRNIRIYNMETGKQKKAFKASVGDDGTLLKVTHDRSGAFLAASCSDKTTAMLDFFSGEVIGLMYGHSEIVTGVRFSNDLKHVITVSADGCIFIWRIHPEVAHRMQAKLKDPVRSTKSAEPDGMQLYGGAAGPSTAYAAQTGPAELPSMAAARPADVATATVTTSEQGRNEEPASVRRSRPGLLSSLIGLTPVREDVDAEGEEDASDGDGSPDTAGVDYRFSFGQLPSWAKKQLADGTSAGDRGLGAGTDNGSELVDVSSTTRIAAPAGRVELGDDDASKGLPTHAGSDKYPLLEDENGADDFHEILKSEVIYYPTEEANRENDGDFKVVEALRRDLERDSTSDNASVHTYEDEEEEDDEAAAAQQQPLALPLSPTSLPSNVPFDQMLYEFEQEERESEKSPSSAPVIHHHIPPELHSTYQQSQPSQLPREKPVASGRRGNAEAGRGSIAASSLSASRAVASSSVRQGTAAAAIRQTQGPPQPSSSTSSQAVGHAEEQPHGGEGRQPASDAPRRSSVAAAAAVAHDSSRLTQSRRSRSRESLQSSGGDSLRSVPSLNEDDRTETVRQRSQSTKDLSGWRKSGGPASGAPAVRPSELPLKAGSSVWAAQAGSATSAGGGDDRLARKGSTVGLSAAATAIVDRLSGSGSRRQDVVLDELPVKDVGAMTKTVPPRANGSRAGASDSGRVATSIVSMAAEGFGAHNQIAEGAMAALRSAVGLVKQSRDQLAISSAGGSGASREQLVRLDEAVNGAVDQLSAIVARSPAVATDSLMEPLLERYSEKLLAVLREKLEGIGSSEEPRGSSNNNVHYYAAT